MAPPRPRQPSSRRRSAAGDKSAPADERLSLRIGRELEGEARRTSPACGFVTWQQRHVRGSHAAIAPSCADDARRGYACPELKRQVYTGEPWPGPRGGALDRAGVGLLPAVSLPPKGRSPEGGWASYCLSSRGIIAPWGGQVRTDVATRGAGVHRGVVSHPRQGSGRLYPGGGRDGAACEGVWRQTCVHVCTGRAREGAECGGGARGRGAPRRVSTQRCRWRGSQTLSDASELAVASSPVCTSTDALQT
jgi:hypothetical protein